MSLFYYRSDFLLGVIKRQYRFASTSYSVFGRLAGQLICSQNVMHKALGRAFAGAVDLSLVKLNMANEKFMTAAPSALLHDVLQHATSKIDVSLQNQWNKQKLDSVRCYSRKGVKFANFLTNLKCPGRAGLENLCRVCVL